jgi:hypothetical protein
MKPCWVLAPLLLLLATGCATSRVVRMDTGQGEPIAFIPRIAAEPVKLEDDEFQQAVFELSRNVRPPANPQQAARQLFGVSTRSGSYLINPRTGRVTPLGDASLTVDPPQADVELTRAYQRWCERTGRPGDCLRLLTESPTLTGDGRYALAMAFAQGAVLDELLAAFKDMADPQAVLSAVLWTATFYLILWTAPEPVSKGLAAVMTATLIAYLGVDTFWSLIEGFKQLVEVADHATTFDELRSAGERYGKVMGQNAARAFALLATVAIGNTASGFASRVPMLPSSAQASARAGAGAGIVLSAVGEVRAVSTSGVAITMALAPGAVSTTVPGVGGAAASPVDAEGHAHHIATDKWWESPHSGGPWSPQFEVIFNRAGMSLNDPANIVHVRGHKGPHPAKYHEQVLRRLDEATATCRTIQKCQEALKAELQQLAREIATPGTRLNKLVTRSE